MYMSTLGWVAFIWRPGEFAERFQGHPRAAKPNKKRLQSIIVILIIIQTSMSKSFESEGEERRCIYIHIACMA